MPAQKIIVKLYFIFSLIISISISVLWGKHVPFTIQKTLAGVLTGISSILFGVLGIWIGLLAPDNLKSIYTSNNKEVREANWSSLETLYKPVFISLIVFVFATIFSFTGDFLKLFNYFEKCKTTFRSIGSFIINLLLFMTIYLVFLAIKPGLEMLAKSFIVLRRSNKIDSLFPDDQKK